MENIKESVNNNGEKIKESVINRVVYSLKKSGKSNLKKFIKPWKRLAHWLNETWIILAFFGLIFLIIYKIWLIKLISGIHISDKWLTYMFSTGDGKHFQWVGISTMLAVVAFIFNAIWNKKNFNADIKSKSRIDWMKTVRLIISEYGMYASFVYHQDKEINIKKVYPKSTKEKLEEMVNIFNNTIIKYRLSRSQLTLYISNADDNEDLNQAIDNIDKKLEQGRRHLIGKNNIDKLISKNNGSKITLGSDETEIELEDLIEELVNVSQDYFKNEWERAKRGE